jgi:hypothetical protein
MEYGFYNCVDYSFFLDFQALYLICNFVHTGVVRQREEALEGSQCHKLEAKMKPHFSTMKLLVGMIFSGLQWI